MSAFTLCECDLGTGKKLPPHLHYQAGLVTMPNGEEKWLGGAMTAYQKEFVSMDIRMPVEEVAALFATPTDAEEER